MSKRELRWFTLVSFLLAMASIGLLILVNNLYFVYFIYGSEYLAFLGGLGCVVAGLLLLTTMILATIRLGQIKQWTWFGLLLTTMVLFFPLGVVVHLLYLFIGPDAPPVQPAQPAQAPAYILPVSAPGSRASAVCCFTATTARAIIRTIYPLPATGSCASAACCFREAVAVACLRRSICAILK